MKASATDIQRLDEGNKMAMVGMPDATPVENDDQVHILPTKKGQCEFLFRQLGSEMRARISSGSIVITVPRADSEKILKQISKDLNRIKNADLKLSQPGARRILNNNDTKHFISNLEKKRNVLVICKSEDEEVETSKRTPRENDEKTVSASCDRTTNQGSAADLVEGDPRKSDQKVCCYTLSTT